MATWPSGKARVCKTLIPSSILGVYVVLNEWYGKALTRVRSFFYVVLNEWYGKALTRVRSFFVFIQHPSENWKDEGRACSPGIFLNSLRGGQAVKPLCPPTTRNAKRSESGVLNSQRVLNRYLLYILTPSLRR